MQEIWKNIEGYENKYQVSNLGNVRSLNFNNSGKIQNLKFKINKHGYYEVKLSKNNKVKNFLVGTLVAKAFIPNKSNKPKVMHLSSNKQDNSVKNLKWSYISEIKYRMYKLGRRKNGTYSGNNISYKGNGFKNIKDICFKKQINYRNVYNRLERGWELEDAIEIPQDLKNRGNKPLFYEYNGEYKTLRQLSKENNISENLIRQRLQNKWNIYEAVEVPKRKRGKVNV